jgi:hypothetical protein
MALQHNDNEHGVPFLVLVRCNCPDGLVLGKSKTSAPSGAPIDLFCGVIAASTAVVLLLRVAPSSV